MDVDHFDERFIGRLFYDAERTARQQAPLRSLRSVDAFVRSHYLLEIEHQETRPAHSFSGARFRDDRMTLTLYRRARAAGASGQDDR